MSRAEYGIVLSHVTRSSKVFVHQSRKDWTRTMAFHRWIVFSSKNNCIFQSCQPICLSFSENDGCQQLSNYIIERVHHRYSHILCWFALQPFLSETKGNLFLCGSCPFAVWIVRFFFTITCRRRCSQHNHPFSYSLSGYNCCSCDQPCWLLKIEIPKFHQKGSDSVTAYSSSIIA